MRPARDGAAARCYPSEVAPKSPEDVDPTREHALNPAVRDLVAGAVLLGLGLWTGGSSLVGDFDRLDVLFDVLGGVWMLWGLIRIVRYALHTRGSSGPSV